MRMFQERKESYAIVGPFEDQARITTGERKSLREALEAAEKFDEEVPVEKLRLVKTTTIVYTEILPYPQRHKACPNCASK